MSTPHRDARHKVCIRCGYRDDGNLHGLGAWVALRKPLPIRSEVLRVDEEITGHRLALGYTGIAGHDADRVGLRRALRACSSRSPAGTC